MIRRRPTAPPAALSDEMRRLLLEGPWAIGRTLNDIPKHDTLRHLWQVHGATLVGTLRRGARPWFVERDHFVRALRREDPA